MFRRLSVVGAVSGSFVAAYAFLDTSVDDAFVVVAAGAALASALSATAMGGPMFAAGVLAAAQGAIWLILLIHGGKGLIFGPLAWLAAIVGTRFPAVAAGMILSPVSWLALSWAPILSERPAPGDWLIVSALVLPAMLAATIYLTRFVRRISGSDATRTLPMTTPR
jgi:hypothetical protein